MKKFWKAAFLFGLLGTAIFALGVEQGHKPPVKTGKQSVPAAPQEAAAPAVAPRTGTEDVLVKVVTPSGTDVYSKDLVFLDILVDDSGVIRMLHVIHISGTEKDTHSWYNFANVEKVTYQYFSITGKSKVRVKQVSGPIASKEDKDAIPPLRYEEYR